MNRFFVLCLLALSLGSAQPSRAAQDGAPKRHEAEQLARQVEAEKLFFTNDRLTKWRARAMAAKGPERLERLRRVTTEALVASDIPLTRHWMAIYSRDIEAAGDERHARALAQLKVYERSLDGELMSSSKTLNALLDKEPDPVIRASGRRLLAYMLADADRKGHALEAVRLGLADAQRVKDPTVRAALLLGLHDAWAYTAMRMNDMQAFMQETRAGIDLAKTVEEPFDGGSVIFNLARMTAAEGDPMEARRIAPVFYRFAAKAHDNVNAFSAKRLCVLVSAAAKDYAQSLKCADEALNGAYVPPEHRHTILMARVNALAHLGKGAEARQDLTKLQAIAAKRADDTLNEQVLQTEAEVLRAEGHSQQAYDTLLRFHEQTMRSQSQRLNAGVKELRENLERDVAYSKARLADSQRVKRLQTWIALVSASAFIFAMGLIVLLLRFQRRLAAAKKHAEDANDAKSAFLANMSHEIRTPLNGVIGVASMLMKTDLSRSQKEMVSLVQSSGHVLERLLSDILDLAKVEAGKLNLETAPFDLKKSMQETAALFRPVCEQKGVGFSIKCDDALDGLFLGDEVRIRQIVTNLVSNAVKFTEAGEVAVMLSAEPGGSEGRTQVRIEVADTGVGFDPKAAASLFERFQQADSSTTRKFGGTGLGLAICQSLVHAMEGEISAWSRPGAGSVFSVVLPLARAAEADIPKATTAFGRKGFDLTGARVLLADDHPINHKVIDLILSSQGAELTVVEDG
ncbi:MAG: ATP-binding protein, partial [Caulobacteraceae bacterium]